MVGGLAVMLVLEDLRENTLGRVWQILVIVLIYVHTAAMNPVELIFQVGAWRPLSSGGPRIHASLSHGGALNVDFSWP